MDQQLFRKKITIMRKRQNKLLKMKKTTQKNVIQPQRRAGVNPQSICLYKFISRLTLQQIISSHVPLLINNRHYPTLATILFVSRLYEIEGKNTLLLKLSILSCI